MKFPSYQKNKSLWIVFFFFIFVSTLFFLIAPGNASANWFVNAVKKLLIYLLEFEGYLLSAAVALFGHIVDPVELNKIIDNGAIKETWKMVRDSLNFAFIIMLLFSAFSTIFQVEKYSYKKILLHLVLMALLVNFSYPIARFVIDISNVLMYTILNNLFPNFDASKIFTGLAKDSGLGKLVKPGNVTTSANFSFLIAAIIFVFMFMITIMTLAILLVIRAIALAILIIFSPIGFVASISPATSNYSDDYWKELIKYSFFGPLIIFTLSVAIKLIASISASGGAMDMMKFANKTSVDSNFVTAIAFFAIPIIIMWMGIGLAQKMGIAGAAMAQKAGKAAVMGATVGAAAYGLRKSGIAGGLKQRVDDIKKKGVTLGRFNFGGSDNQEKRDARWAQRFGKENAHRNYTRKKNNEKINEDAQNDSRNSNQLLIDLNSNIHTSLAAPVGDPAKKTTATTAQALRNLGDTELQNVIENNASMLYSQVASGDGVFGNLAVGSSIANSLENIANNAASEEDLRRVTGYLRQRAGEAKTDGVNNG